MPRPPGLILGALCGALGSLLVPGSAPAQSAASPCAAEFGISETKNGLIELRLRAPCQPYARVEIVYGPFVVTEETSFEGIVDLRLPRLAGVPEAAAQLGHAVLFAALPPGPTPASRYVALVWRGTPTLGMTLPQDSPAAETLSAGFALDPSARRAAIVLLTEDATTPEFADIHLSDGACLQAEVSGAILTSESDRRLPLDVALPACGPDAGFIRIPLPASAPDQR